jgi:hypothetical protein
MHALNKLVQYKLRHIVDGEEYAHSRVFSCVHLDTLHHM